MSTKAIIAVLADLIKLHKTFNELAEKKAEVVKKGDMPALDDLIKQETTLIKKLKNLEEDRLFVVKEYLQSKGWMLEGVTMEQLIESAPKEEQLILSRLQKGLLSEMKKLQEQNQLNQQLIEESLRFVNLSLDLVAPQPDDDVNYQRPTNAPKGYDLNGNRSMFDSKI